MKFSNKYFMTRLVFAISILSLMVIVTFQMPVQCAGTNVVVVASTSWTGAIAEAAGAGEVVVLAPLELKHPPEYDYRPADIARLNNAAFVVQAGYEPFMKKLLEAAAFPESRICNVMTMNEPNNLKQQARILAEKFGTMSKEAEWEAKFDKVTADIQKKAILKKAAKTRVLVQQHQQPFVKWIGFEVIGVFSAGEMSPAKIKEYADLKPDLIIDNYHNPQGKPVMEIAKCKYVELINFPSTKAPGLIELFIENASRLGL